MIRFATVSALALLTLAACERRDDPVAQQVPRDTPRQKATMLDYLGCYIAHAANIEQNRNAYNPLPKGIRAPNCWRGGCCSSRERLHSSGHKNFRGSWL